MKLIIVTLLLLTLFYTTTIAQSGTGLCTHQFFCYGSVLNILQNTRLYHDDKDLVDRTITSIDQEEFRRLFSEMSVDDRQNKTIIQNFIDKYTSEPGYDLIEVEPTDFNPNPTFINHLPEELKPFARNIHQRWKTLYRAPKRNLPHETTSLIQVPHPFIVAGGRFREWYNWDSYWIINGLFVSEMRETGLNMINNMLYCIDKYGFIPNGGRIYYLNRSQPTFTAQLIWEYYKRYYTQEKESHKLGLEFLHHSYTTLLKEYQYWMSPQHIITLRDNLGQLHNLNRYNVQAIAPRPESWTKDYDIATKYFKTVGEQKAFYSNIASGAETGWDFSSRWMNDYENLYTIKTTDIIPVDLNSILYNMEKYLKLIAMEIGDNDNIQRFTIALDQRRIAIYRYLWSETKELWYDYQISTQSRRITTPKGQTTSYLSQFLPIWSGASHLSLQQGYNTIVEYIEKNIKVGGIPTSMIDNEQQWDGKNVWAPLQYFMSQALLNSYYEDEIPTHKNNPTLFKVIDTWITTTYCGWKTTPEQHMYEKYNANEIGKPGGDGEYDVQNGFGWTNGLVLMYLEKFGKEINLQDCTKK